MQPYYMNVYSENVANFKHLGTTLKKPKSHSRRTWDRKNYVNV